MTLLRLDRHGNVVRFLEAEKQYAPRALVRMDRGGRVVGRKYSPDQPRVPVGSPEGGRWTAGKIRDFGGARRGTGGAWWEQSDEEKESMSWAEDNWSPYAQNVRMSLSEDRQVTAYMTKDYEGLNRTLREGGSLTAAQKRMLKALDKITAQTTAPEDVYVYRAIKGKFQSGMILGDDAYPSTSLLRDIAVEFGEVYERVGRGRQIARILVPKGTPSAFIAGFAPNKGTRFQQEVLLGRGLRFRVVSIGDVVEMEVVL